MKRVGCIAATAALLIAGVSIVQAGGLDTARIEQLTGLKGTMNDKEGVFKVSSPRTDVKVTVDGWTMPPFMGLTTWAGFALGKKQQAMVMGDLVLLQDEVNPVLSAALDSGLEVTALHNHFFYDEPHVYFMHIGGEGNADKLASAVGKVLATISDVRKASPTPAKGFGSPPSSRNAITPEPIEAIIGTHGQRKDGMLKIVLGRKVKMKCDCEAGKDMGVNTWAAFAGTDQAAVVDGDFAMEEDELQPVLKALRAARINIVAIHNHMAEETPRLVFLHYWGTGPAQNLATGLKAALDTQKK